MQTQQHVSGEAHSAQQAPMFTAEEAGAILNLAAQLHDSHLSQEQLITIAEEAGIPRETLQRAIAEFQRQQRQKALQQEQAQRARRHKRRKLWLILASLALLVMWGIWTIDEQGGFGGLSGKNSSTTSPSVWIASSPQQILASTSGCTVYKQPYTTEYGETFERVFLQVAGSEPLTLGQNFGRVDFATISPDGELVALYDSRKGEVWIVQTDGKGLACVARAGETINVSGRTLTLSTRNPIVGWEKSAWGNLETLSDDVHLYLWDSRHRRDYEYRLVLRANNRLVIYRVVDRIEPIAVRPR
ncbi:MAG: helix-turn-helix domain-containing protein [Fimbriimonadales bacterium]|nr:helix-turn-helix domain-containing protein [Fimbriimonadales bacterium]